MVSPLVVLLSCAGDPQPDTASQPMQRATPLQLLVRASLDFRGVRPSGEEVEWLTDEPDALDEMIDTFIDDERFPDRIIALYQEIYLSNTENIDLRPNTLPFADTRLFYWAVGQEPLQLLAQIVREDLPYTEIVTADWTMANEELSEWFPVTWTEGDTGWHKVQYTDGRPAAGVIATNGLWWRYVTTEANANRRRANALTRILVCEDFLERPITFDQTANAQDEAAINDAIHNNPACINCHVALDPIASNLFGFYWTNFTSVTEGRTYSPGLEQTWRELTGTSPGWYGTPTTGLSGLGAVIAADPRLPTCAVEQAFELMMRRPVSVDDADDLVALREVFLADDLRLKSLYRAIADLDVYQAARDETDDGALPLKMMAPDVLATSIEAITGLTWMAYTAPALYTDLHGVRALAGGVEGVMIKQPAVAPDATILLVQEAIAATAASYALRNETGLDPEERRLFREVDFTESLEADEAVLRAQLQSLHLRVLSQQVELDGPEVDAGLALWVELLAIEGVPILAWQGVLEALLRDPAYLLY
ncbi:MAG: hypothetical protein ACI8RZ_002619 [Myxococcota bacterium]|jgi:hypothetical protein